MEEGLDANVRPLVPLAAGVHRPPHFRASAIIAHLPTCPRPLISTPGSFGGSLHPRRGLCIVLTSSCSHLQLGPFFYSSCFLNISRPSLSGHYSLRSLRRLDPASGAVIRHSDSRIARIIHDSHATFTISCSSMLYLIIATRKHTLR